MLRQDSDVSPNGAVAETPRLATTQAVTPAVPVIARPPAHRHKEVHVTGRLVTEAPPLVFGTRIFRPRGLRISGRLVNAATGYPVTDLSVSIFVTAPGGTPPASGRAAAAAESVLGTAVSGAGGVFAIDLDDTPAVRQQVRMLQQGHVCYYLKVQRGEAVYYTSPLRQGAVPSDLTINVSLPLAAVTRTTWSTVSARLEGARMTQLHAIAGELVSKPAAQSLFGDWEPALRHAVAYEVEQTFADPDGVLRKVQGLPTFHALRQPGALETYVEAIARASSPAVDLALNALLAKASDFHDLRHVDWVIDVTEIGKGALGKAVTKYQDHYADVTLYGDATRPELRVGPPSALERYRDYLRAIFTGPTSSGGFYAQYKQKLETRFHQSFDTSNTTDRPANQVVIPIVRAILTSPVGPGYGFGLSPASLPAQGTKTHREHLDELIALSGLTARELGLRFRIDLERPDTARSSAVAENIATLQRFYRDGFQSGVEPAQSPLIFPGHLLGDAPFFLHYDEWLDLTKPSYPENLYQITQSFSSGVVPQAREFVERATTVIVNAGYDSREDAQWVLLLMDIEKEMNDGHRAFGHSQFVDALDHYETALTMAHDAVKVYADHGWHVPAYNADSAIAEPYIGPYDTEDFSHYDNFVSWILDNGPKLFLQLVHLMAYVIPVCKGDVALALGNYAAAVAHYGSTTRALVATVVPQDGLTAGAYVNDRNVNDSMGGQPVHVDGSLPYTAVLPTTGPWPARKISHNPDGPVDMVKYFRDHLPAFAEMVEKMPAAMEKKFFRLRQGNAMLEWADALYRTDEAASIARARELYKGVLFLHGMTPPIRPNWGTVPVRFTLHSPNPAVRSQTKRARRGFNQIELGLNYYGVSDAFVPVLRYRPLKDTADRLAASAKSAQQDFLTYLGRVEDAMKEAMVTATMLKKATLQTQVADEQIKVAEFNVMVAEQQVAQVEAAIEAKKQEIQDYGGWEILGDLVSGMTDAVTDFAKDKDVKAAAAGNSATSGSAATSGMGATVGVMGAVGMVIYAGVVSCVAIQDGMDQRHAELHALQDVALPMAKANLEARESELTIANLQRDIAEADAELATALIRFQANRTLNIEFWNSVVIVVKRVLRRYLELGARFAWLAERALAYEQDRALDMVRFDYFPRRLQGVTGADLLQLDLAELEAARLEGIRNMMPIRHTYSMLADFPFAFSQLKNEGRCTFRTTELPFRLAHPGTFGHRVIAVSVVVKGMAGGLPLRGLLRNRGISVVSRENGEPHVSARFPDAFPLSEFRLRDDMAVYRLPDEALMSFEGSGIDSFWELSFPTAANPYGLKGVADIEITFDVRASYSPTLYETHLASAPTSVKRFLFFSAAQHAPTALAALRNTAPGSPTTVAITLNPGQIGLPAGETSRVVSNLLVCLGSEAPLALPATFARQGTPPVAVTFAQSMVLSNAAPWSDPAAPPPPAPLNQFIGAQVAQNWTLTINKAAAPGVNFATIADVVLAIEYTATLG